MTKKKQENIVLPALRGIMGGAGILLMPNGFARIGGKNSIRG